MKPENVLICIDDVEAIIQAELAAQSASPTRLVGVPPSRGRGGNQTPRSESVFITGSQPLPSPSSSYGSTSVLDKWAFGMSKIDAPSESKPGSLGKDVLGGTDTALNGKAAEKRADSAEQAADKLSGVSLDTSPFGQKTRPESKSKPSGPSLLSQQAAAAQQSPATSAPPPISASASTSSQSPAVVQGRQQALHIAHEGMEGIGDLLDAGMSTGDAAEKITVKIADLGNGESLSFDRFSLL